MAHFIKQHEIGQLYIQGLAVTIPTYRVVIRRGKLNGTSILWEPRNSSSKAEKTVALCAAQKHTAKV